MLQDLPNVNTAAAQGQNAATPESEVAESDSSTAAIVSKSNLAIKEENQL